MFRSSREDRIVAALRMRGKLRGTPRHPTSAIARLAIAAALFFAGGVTDRLAARWHPFRPAVEAAGPAMALQAAGSEYVRSLARVANSSRVTDRVLGGEVALSGFRGVAAEFGRLDPTGNVLQRAADALSEAQLALKEVRGGQ